MKRKGCAPAASKNGKAEKNRGEYMTNISKNFKCTCGTEYPFAVTTDLELADIAIAASCQNCGSPMQIHLGSLCSHSKPAAQQSQASALPSLDDSIFVPPEMPSEEIKKLIEG